MKVRLTGNKDAKESIEKKIDEHTANIMKNFEEDGYGPIRRIDVLLYFFQKKYLNVITNKNSSLMCKAKEYIREQLNIELDNILEDIVQKKEEKGLSTKQIIEDLKEKNFLEKCANIDLSIICNLNNVDRTSLNKLLQKQLEKFISKKEEIINCEETNDYVDFIQNYTNDFNFLAKDRWIYNMENLNMKHSNTKFKSFEEYNDFVKIQNKIKNKMENNSCTELNALEMISNETNLSEIETKIFENRKNILIKEKER